MDCFDIFIQVKFIQFIQKFSDAVVFMIGSRTFQKPFAEPVISGRKLLNFRNFTSHQSGKSGNFGWCVQFSGNKGSDRMGELFTVGGISGAVADTEYGGSIIVGIFAQPFDIDIQ